MVRDRPFDRLPIDDTQLATLNETVLKNVIFRYSSTCLELLNVLLELDTWRMAPRLLLIDSLQTFFKAPMTVDDSAFCADHCLLIAAIQNTIESLTKRHGKMCFSITSIDFDVEQFRPNYEGLRQTLIDLYFHRENQVSRNFHCIEEIILEEFFHETNSEK